VISSRGVSWSEELLLTAGELREAYHMTSLVLMSLVAKHIKFSVCLRHGPGVLRPGGRCFGASTWASLLSLRTLLLLLFESWCC
jgi:hypothetical protein